MSQESIHLVTRRGNGTLCSAIATALSFICVVSMGEAHSKHGKERCIGLEFEKLVAKVGAYTGKRVCVTGIAGVDGISFTLSAPPRLKIRQLIVIDRHRNVPNYDRLNNHLVKVTGIVHNDPEKLFACRILLENIEVLARQPVKGVRVYGIFFNEGPDTIRLDVVNKAGNENDSMTLSPGDVLKTVIVEGTAKVSPPSTGASPGPVLSTCIVPTANSARDFFEESTRTFYFRVTNGRVELVKPPQARAAKERWKEIERINNSQ